MTLRKFLRVFFLVFAAALYGGPPPVPSAGVVERELEREYENEPLKPQKEVPSIQIDIPKERLDIPEGRCIEVKHIEVIGAQSISKKEVQSWVREYEGRQICLKEIYQICAKIDAEYVKRGYFLARSYPPPQTISEGVLVLEVLEGRLGNIKVEGERFYSEAFIQSYFTRLRGKGLNYDAFMRALLLLNGNSDLQAGAVFSKGEEFGTVDLVIRVVDKKPIHLYLNGNNYGKDITTNIRAGGRLDVGNIFTYGDTFSLAEVVGSPANALYFTEGRYRVPIGVNGDFFEMQYLYSKFKVEELLSLHLSGVSNIATIKGTHALVRSRDASIDLFEYFDVKQIQNRAMGIDTSFDKLRVLTMGSVMDFYGSKNGRDYLNARMAIGIPNFLWGMDAVSSDCSRPGAGGLFVKLNADYDHLHMFDKDIILCVHGSGQGSFYKLAIPEQIYIGGIDTVRGFPLAVALGDSGYYINLELKFPPPILANQRFSRVNKKWRDVLQLAAFLDTGGTFYYGGSNTFLWGSGIGIRFKGPLSLTFSCDIGFPLNKPSLSKGTMAYLKVTGQPF